MEWVLVERGVDHDYWRERDAIQLHSPASLTRTMEQSSAISRPPLRLVAGVVHGPRVSRTPNFVFDTWKERP